MGRRGGVVTTSYEDRVARYERIRAAKASGLTLDAIGRVEGLTKQRVRTILANPPKPIGRPRKEDAERP